MKKKKLLIIISVLVVVATAWVLWGNLTVGLTKVTIQEESLPMAFHGLKIAHVSDLHNSHLWKQAIKQLQKAQPDIICITGDLVDSSRTNLDTALAFAAEAVKIAPCYYVPGNHESGLDPEVFADLKNGLLELGVKVLMAEYDIITRGDEQICIAGLGWNLSKLDSLQPYDGYRILLAHYPEYLEKYAQADVDLVLSGHAHGGQFRIPFLGGVLAPGQGFFPKYDAGHFVAEDTEMYISRGIGNSSFPLRLNNRPEVILITLKT
jgi:predicted MPP superfamily phosphohydrolase